MKIKSLRLKNFLLIKSGMGKNEIFIDFTKLPNPITILVGQMGSGKTTILGHLQPGPSFGTLDDRNQLPDIISGENGLKEIVYDVNGVEIVCKHIYTWTKDHHAVKSYISKDGVEMNQNGNQSSFKELQELLLGINANYLRLIRIGPNVTNLINLSAAERKAFMADLLSDIDIYSIIYDDILKRTRNIQAQTQILAKKLADASDENIKKMKSELKECKSEVLDIRSKIKRHNSLLQEKQAQNNLYLDGRTLSEYSKAIDKKHKELEELASRIEITESNINSVESEYSSVSEVLVAIGTASGEITKNTQLIQSLQSDYMNLQTKKTQLMRDSNGIQDSQYIENLHEQFDEYVNIIAEYKEDLSGFDCPYSSTEIKSLLAEIQVFDASLEDATSYGNEIVRAVLDQGKSAIPHSRHKIDMLQGRKFKLQRSLSNIQFIKKYDVSDELEIPEGCKCVDVCPYFITHPNVVRDKNSDKQLDEQYKSIMDEIDEIDKKIETYLVYPVVYGKIESLKSSYSHLADKLKKIGALRTSGLQHILTNASGRVWYTYDKIASTMEECDKRERMFSMESKVSQIKAEIDAFDRTDASKLLEEINVTVKQMEDDSVAIDDLETRNKELKDHVTELEEIYDSLTTLDREKAELEKMKTKMESLSGEEYEMRNRYNTICSNQEQISNLSLDIRTLELQEAKKNDKFNQLQRYLDSVSEAKEEFGILGKKLEIMSYIRDAASSKKGIPLFYIQIFLNDCLDAINDMVSTIFGDSIEILKFEINDTEFSIPYTKDGIKVSDIKYCSQGERAVVSIALSFALMRNGLLQASGDHSVMYNIPLLDEVDGPLHKDERENFLTMVAHQIKEINAEQAFLITHNNCFDGAPVNIILTSDEIIDNKMATVVRLY